jgi:hypothetical protein
MGKTTDEEANFENLIICIHDWPKSEKIRTNDDETNGSTV